MIRTCLLFIFSCCLYFFSEAQMITKPGTKQAPVKKPGAASGNAAASTAGLVSFSGVKDLALGQDHYYAVKEDGTLWSWGSNSSGELGVGSRLDMDRPKQVGEDSDWSRVFSTYESFSIALKEDGSLWAWGENSYGQLGDGSFTTKVLPVRVGTDKDWKMVWSDNDAVFALKRDGSLWSWGKNMEGILGVGEYLPSICAPRKIDGGPWVTVSIGYEYAAGVKADGTLWAWGENSSGKVGDGTSVTRFAPVQIGKGTQWQTVEVGSGHALALDRQGGLWAWGGNYDGCLGDGTNSSKYQPVRIKPDTRWRSVSAGTWFSVGVDQSGYVWSWGNNNRQQLGDGTENDRNTPGKVGSDNTWEAVYALDETVFGFKRDGSLWSWGSSQFSFLGTGEGFYTDRGVPTKLAGTGWKKVDLTYSKVGALREDGSIWVWGNGGDDGSGPLGAGKISTDRVGKPLAIKYAYAANYPAKRKNELPESFWDNGLGVISREGKLGVINKARKELIAPKYDNIFPSESAGFNSNGSVFWAAYNNKWGVVDQNGNELLPFIYEDVSGFVKGLARVRKNGKIGYINEDGEEKVPFIYDNGYQFDDLGMATVNYKGKWGVVDDKGKVVIPYLYDQRLFFYSNKAETLLNGEKVYINRQGERVAK